MPFKWHFAGGMIVASFYYAILGSGSTMGWIDYGLTGVDEIRTNNRNDNC